MSKTASAEKVAAKHYWVRYWEGYMTEEACLATKGSVFMIPQAWPKYDNTYHPDFARFAAKRAGGRLHCFTPAPSPS